MYFFRDPLLFTSEMIGNGEGSTSFGAAACKHFAAIGSCHSFTETVFVNSFTVRRLECSFHCLMWFSDYYRTFRSANLGIIYLLCKFFCPLAGQPHQNLKLFRRCNKYWVFKEARYSLFLILIFLSGVALAIWRASFLNMERFCPEKPLRERHASSLNVTSRCQCSWFSMPQCPRASIA